MMEFIHNVYPGACASIVFYQFVKSSGKLSYDDLEKFVKSLNDELGNDLHAIGKYLVKYWSGIRNGSVEFKDLPDSGNPREINDENIDLGLFGKSEYGLMSFFCRVLFWAHIGYWIQTICNKSYEEVCDYKRYNDYFDKYNEFMLKYTSTIPYVSYVAFVDENDIIENLLHVVLTIKNDNEFMIYDSNMNGVDVIDSYEELWFSKDDNIFY